MVLVETWTGTNALAQDLSRCIKVDRNTGEVMAIKPFGPRECERLVYHEVIERERSVHNR